MVDAVFEAMVDWDNTGLFGDGSLDDITADVLRAEWFIGRDKASMLTGKSRGGQCLLTLDNDTNNGKYNSYNSTSSLHGSIFPGRPVRLRGGGGSYPSTVLASSPVGYWRFDESSGNAQDETANNNDGVITGLTQGASTVIIDPTGGSISCNGSTGYVTVAADAAIRDIFNSGGSVEFWLLVRSDGEGNQGHICTKGGWSIYVSTETNGKVRLEFDQVFTGTDGAWNTEELVLTINQPHHVLLRYNNLAANSPSIDVDGVSVTVAQSSVPTGLISTDAGSNLIIGNRAADDRAFFGWIDELAIYSDTVTADESMAHYIAGGVIVWTGKLDVVNPQISISEANTALLEAMGPLAWLSRADFDLFLFINTNQLSGAVMNDLLDAVSWPAGSRNIDAGRSTIAQYYFNKSGVLGTRDRKVSFIDAAHKVEETENGFLHEGKNGIIKFEDRDHRLDSVVVTAKVGLSDDPSAGEITYGTIDQSDLEDEIFNLFTTTIQNYTVGSITDIWTNPEAVVSGANIPTIPAGQSKTYVAAAPVDASYDVISLWTTPVATTDFLANSEADGTGTNVTGDIAVVVVKSTLLMTITFTNNHASLDAKFTLMKARGQPLNLDNPVLVLAQNVVSQAKYGIRKFPIPAEMVRDTEEGQDHVDWLNSVYSEVRPKLDMTIYANKDSDHLEHVLIRDISDCIDVEANSTRTQLGLVDHHFFIESMKHTVVPGIFWTAEWSCSSIDKLGSAGTGSDHPFWVLGASKLGQTTGLHY